MYCLETIQNIRIYSNPCQCTIFKKLSASVKIIENNIIPTRNVYQKRRQVSSLTKHVTCMAHFIGKKLWTTSVLRPVL